MQGGAMPPPTTLAQLSSFLTHSQFIPTCRLLVSTLLAALFTLIPPLRPNSCFAAVFAVWAQTQMHTDNSLGTAINAAALLLSGVWVGVLSGGAMASLALLAPAGVARTAAQCCLGVFGLALLAVMRAGPEPSSLAPQGILSTIFYGLVIIQAQFDVSWVYLWQNSVGALLVAVLLSVTSTLAAAVFVLPTLASEQIPGMLVSLIRDMGAAVSSGSRLLTPRPRGRDTVWGPHSARWIASPAGGGGAGAGAKASGNSTAHGHQEAEGPGTTDVPLLPAASLVFQEPLELVHDSNIRLLSTATLPLVSLDKLHKHHVLPATPATTGTTIIAAKSAPLPPGTAKAQVVVAATVPEAEAEKEEEDVDLVLAWYLPAVGSLRQRLTAAKALLPASSVEPAWFRCSCSCTCPCMGGRVRRQARLKGRAMGRPHPRYRGDEWAQLIEASTVLISRIASLESVLEEGRLTWNSESLMIPAIQQILALTAATTARVSLHLSAWLSGRAGPGGMPSSSSGSVGDAATAPEEWAAACGALRHAFACEIGSYWRQVREASKANPMVVGPARAFMTLSFLGSLAASMVGAAEKLQAATDAILAPHELPWQQQHQQQETVERQSDGAGDLETGFTAAAGASAGGEAAGKAGAADAAGAAGTAGTAGTAGAAFLWLVDYLLGWLRPVARTLLFVAPLVHFCAMCRHLGKAVKDKAALQLLSRRYVQAGFKFWLAVSVALVVILVLSAAVPWIATGMPVFGFIASVSAMRERVESTLEKVAARVIGTILGATVGFGIMSSLVLANSPGALIGFLAAACLLLGPLSQVHLRLMVGLTLWTFAATMLCQYKGCCGATQGHVNVYVTRLVSVAGGVLWCSVLNRVLLPWRGAAYEVESMADTVKTTVALLRAGYEMQYEAAERAAYGPPPAPNDGGSSGHLARGGSRRLLESGSVRGGASMSRGGSLISRVMTWAADGGTKVLDTLSRVTLGGPEEDPRAEERRLLLDPTGVTQAVGTTLVRVQAQMAREGVAWQSGLLAVPQLARAMLAECFRMMDALEGLQLAANTHMELVEASTDASNQGPPAAEAPCEDEQEQPQPAARSVRGGEGRGGGDEGATESGPGGVVILELAPEQGPGQSREGSGEEGASGRQHGAAAAPQSHHPLATSDPHTSGANGASPFAAVARSASHHSPTAAPTSPSPRNGAPHSAPLNAGPSSPRHASVLSTSDLVFQQFVRPVDGVVKDMLNGLELLAVLVVGHCRWPSEATRSELSKQIDVMLELRTAVYEALVRARAQRLCAMRSGTPLVPPALDIPRAAEQAGHARSPGPNAQSGHAGASIGPALQGGARGSEPQHPPCPGGDELTRQYTAVQNSEHAVQYLSLLHAMYKVNNRVMAVARIAMEYGDDVARGRAEGDKQPGAKDARQ